MGSLGWQVLIKAGTHSYCTRTLHYLPTLLRATGYGQRPAGHVCTPERAQADWEWSERGEALRSPFGKSCESAQKPTINQASRGRGRASRHIESAAARYARYTCSTPR